MDNLKMDEDMEEVDLDCVMDDDQEAPFVQLPEEMFLHICSFLDVKDIVLSLSKVCRKFNYMLQSNDTWRAWIAARWGRHAPIVQADEDTNWKKKCFVLEKDWKIFQGPFETQSITHDFCDLDAILLINGGCQCVTGSRLRDITVYSTAPPQILIKCSAHLGWVWKLKYHDNRLYSASWDHTIKLWDFNGISSLTEVAQLRCGSPALSMDIDENGVVYGGSFNSVSAFDPRVGSEPIFNVSSHHSAVLTLNLFENDLISGCENKTLTVWDTRTRTNKQILRIKKKCYAVSAQVLERALYIGDKNGNLRVYQNKDGVLSETAVMNFGRKKPVTSIKISAGSILTNCDNHVTTFLPFKPLKTITEIKAEGGTISSVDYNNGVLALGTLNTLEFKKST